MADLDLAPRPLAANGSLATTRAAVAVLSLLGGTSRGSVVLTEGEMDGLRELYGFTREEHPLLQSGADFALFRHAEQDGLRVVAVLARCLESGADPVRLVLGLLADAGYNVQREDDDYDAEEPHA